MRLGERQETAVNILVVYHSHMYGDAATAVWQVSGLKKPHFIADSTNLSAERKVLSWIQNVKLCLGKIARCGLKCTV